MSFAELLGAGPDDLELYMDALEIPDWWHHEIAYAALMADGLVWIKETPEDQMMHRVKQAQEIRRERR